MVLTVEDVFAEINAARTDPLALIHILSQWRSCFQGNLLCLPGKLKLGTNEGVAAVDEAIAFLRSTKPVPALQRQATVSSLSRDSGLGSGRKSPKDDDSFKRRNAKLKGAAEEMMLGFGSAEERRDKDALIVAAEAFADGVDGFQFDKPMGEALKNDFKKAAAAAKDKKKAGKGMFGGLFDKS